MEWGPLLSFEIPENSLERLRKTRGFTPAAAQLNAAVPSRPIEVLCGPTEGQSARSSARDLRAS